MLIPGLLIDSDSSIPVYRQIADGVRDAALDGRLTPGRRLPPTRDLARQLGVNRQTVVAAYDHLASEGWVSSQTGRGTFLKSSPTPEVLLAAPPDSAGVWHTTFSRAVEGPGVGGLLSIYQIANTRGVTSFAGSYPAPELMPIEAFSRAMTSTLRDSGEQALIYGPTAGHPPLRERIASDMRSKGSPLSTEDILITNGAQQAIDLVFHTFLERGDPVVIEEPTYTGALSVLDSIGARIVDVPVDEQGMRQDALALALERHRPRLLYVQPSFHNPTSSVMGEGRRRELLAIAARNRCVVLEDDWANGLRFDGREPPTLHALDGGQHVVYLSTFSKKLLPGVRIGWIAAPQHVMKRLVALKQKRDCGSSPLLQAALDLFLREGGMEDHLRHVLLAYRERRDCMLRALERHLPPGAVWTRPEGGLFVWVTLPRGFDGPELFAAARQSGVLYSSGEVFHANEGGSHNLRLTYSAASPSEIESGVAKLGSLIRERWPGRRDSREGKPIEQVPIL